MVATLVQEPVQRAIGEKRVTLSTILAFPLTMSEINEGKEVQWDDYLIDTDIQESREFYFGSLESIGFGRTKVTIDLVEQVKKEDVKT